MTDNGALTNVTINKQGGPVSLEVLFGFANIGVYRIFSWDSNNNPTLVGQGNNVDKEPDSHDLPTAPAQLDTTQLSFEAQVQSASTGAGQMYSLFVLVRQDGKIVSNGSIEQSGPLPGGDAKTLFGFVRFA
jgi:hypothetical protein